MIAEFRGHELYQRDTLPMDVTQFIFTTRQQLGRGTAGVGGGAGLMAQWAIGMGLQSAALDPASTGWSVMADVARPWGNLQIVMSTV